MRRRSKTNSRPFEDLDLRDEYRQRNPMCELWPLLKDVLTVDHWKCSVPLSQIRADGAIDINHIFSCGQRPDVWTNFISIHWLLHRHFFHGNENMARCVCLMAKFQKKGGRDWNPTELNRVIGRRCQAYLDYELPWPALETLRRRIVNEIERTAT